MEEEEEDEGNIRVRWTNEGIDFWGWHGVRPWPSIDHEKWRWEREKKREREVGVTFSFVYYKNLDQCFVYNDVAGIGHIVFGIRLSHW